MFIITPEHRAIFDALSSTSDNILVSACPGSGKTTTTIQSFQYIPKDPDSLAAQAIAYLVFNSRNAEEAKAKVPRHIGVSTFHALGRRALVNAGIIKRDNKPDSRKVSKLVWNACDRDNPDTASIIRLVGLLKSHAQKHPSETLVRDIIQLHELDLVDDRAAVRVALNVLDASNRNTDVIDFDDMLYLPVILNLSFGTYDYLFVDEAQDTNDIQINILERSLGAGSRIVAVGDPHQAIYGFRGAQSDALDRIARTFNMITLPLSVSYRCSKAVVAEAQKYE